MHSSLHHMIGAELRLSPQSTDDPGMVEDSGLYFPSPSPVTFQRVFHATQKAFVTVTARGGCGPAKFSKGSEQFFLFVSEAGRCDDLSRNVLISFAMTPWIRQTLPSQPKLCAALGAFRYFKF